MLSGMTGWNEPSTNLARGTADAGPAVTFRCQRRTAMNRKAARRRRDQDLAFGTFPAVVVRGDQTAFVPLAGISPPNATQPMIPLGRHIPLGDAYVWDEPSNPRAALSCRPAERC
jgi:hypothetical protein